MVTASGMWARMRRGSEGSRGMARIAVVAIAALCSAPAMAAPDDLASSSDVARPPVGAAPSIASWQRLAANALLVPVISSAS